MLFPPGLIRLEMQLLLEDHLRQKVVGKVLGGGAQDLAIHMSAGEEVLCVLRERTLKFLSL